MTSLNQKIRDQIIDSVIQKGTTIPARKEALKKKTSLRVRELCLERIPRDFAPATKNLPQDWFPLMASESLPREMNPLLLMNKSDEEIRQIWRGPQIEFEPFRHPMSSRFNRREYLDQGMDNNDPGNPVKIPDDLESWEAKLTDLVKEAQQIREDEVKARLELRQFLYSVKTYKQVIEKMPELERHLPNYTKPMPLTVPVGPILKTLGKLGFDQTEKA